jgi:pyruvate/2-oxoglutarate dehydrogenase complex dihydrolipoamide acyltransferase (E2) component
MDLHIAFDHRVMDGADAAFALRGIEHALEGPIAEELAALLDAAAPSA